MPSSIVVTLTARQQALILAQWRPARYGHLLTLHILLLLHYGYAPTQMAACLFCSRSSVYRSVAAWRSGALQLAVPARLPRPWWGRALADDLRRKLTALLRCVPRAFGWMRTRWSGACWALTLSRQVGYTISAETVRAGSLRPIMSGSVPRWWPATRIQLGRLCWRVSVDTGKI